ncbi:MAG: UDP-3-O-(3-hydroxymyristoyl)glucosamine N-acyltransferase [Candidatus Binatia bacterium]
MKLAEIAARVGCRLDGDGDVEITGVASLDDAAPGTLTFLADRRHAPKLATTRAAAVIVGVDQGAIALPALRAPHPYVAFVAAVELLHPAVRPAAGVHPTALIAPDARIGRGSYVGPYVVVGEGVTIGRDAVLHARVTVYPGAAIGDGFTAHAGVVVREGVRIGDRVVVHAGAVIGSDGFGYLPLPDGPRKIPQVGTVVLEDDVEIGANATVDRAALGATRVGRGTKIDNLVMVGHGCRIGPMCLLAAQVGLAGGTVLGTAVMLGGQAGSAGHLTIGDGAQLAAKAGIHRDVPAGAVQAGYPAVDARLWRRSSGALNRLPGLFRRLRRVERALGLVPDGEEEP